MKQKNIFPWEDASPVAFILSADPEKNIIRTSSEAVQIQGFNEFPSYVLTANWVQT